MDTSQDKIQKYVTPLTNITKQDSFERVVKKGAEIMETNDFFRDLSEIMEDEKFSNRGD